MSSRRDAGAEKELLFRGGETVPLTPKTFQVLLVLVRHSKEVVTKDDLMKMVWPESFVQEANLSRNIFLLRKALGESPQDHHYIVTVPGRGYRFAGDVQVVPEQELNIVAASHTKVAVQIKDTSPWRWWAVAMVLLVAVAAAAAFRLLHHRSPVLTEKDTVVLADFANSAGDPVFDGTLRQGLSVQLEQSPFLSLISDERVRQTLRLMGQPVDIRLTPEIAQDLYKRTQSAALVNGSIAKLRSQERCCGLQRGQESSAQTASQNLFWSCSQASRSVPQMRQDSSCSFRASNTIKASVLRCARSSAVCCVTSATTTF